MPLRIVTYNVRYFGHRTRGLSATQAGIDKIAHALATLDQPADVVCLQEVETRSLRSRLSTAGKQTQLEALCLALERALAAAGRTTRYTAYYFPAHAYLLGPAPLYTTGLAVLAADDLVVDRHNAHEPHEITYRRTRALGWLKQSRVCAHVRLRDRRGQALDVFNTHLSLPAFASPTFWKRGQPRLGYGPNQAVELDTLLDFVDRTRHGEAFVIAGDFNALPDSPVYTRLIERTGARDPFPAAVGLSALALREAWPSAGFWKLRMRLDHVFIGPGLECLDFADTDPFGKPGRWHGLSDHVPLVGRFRRL